MRPYLKKGKRKREKEKGGRNEGKEERKERNMLEIRELQNPA